MSLSVSFAGKQCSALNIHVSAGINSYILYDNKKIGTDLYGNCIIHNPTRQELKVLVETPQRLWLILNCLDGIEQFTLSAIIAYTAEKRDFIEELLGSLELQGHQDLEVVLVDDSGAENDIRSVLTRYSGMNIKYLQLQSQRGLLYSRLAGALESSGDYVTFVDADDFYMTVDSVSQPQHNLHTIVSQSLQAYGHADVIQFGMLLCDGHGRGHWPNLLHTPMNNGRPILGNASINALFYRKVRAPYVTGRVYARPLYMQVCGELLDFALDNKVNMYEGFLQSCVVNYFARSYVEAPGGLSYVYRVGQPNSVSRKATTEQKLTQLLLVMDFLGHSHVQNSRCLAVGRKMVQSLQSRLGNQIEAHLGPNAPE